LAEARRLWDNMVERRMYITGGVGSSAEQERFGPDYELPNNGYLETCAAVGGGFFHRNMNLALADARYADELERVLYNGVLCGVSLKGDSYFYENPLDARASHRRWSWHPCPCCPPMFLKIMGALPGMIYAQERDAVYVNLFIGSRATLSLSGTKVDLRQTTRYPWDGEVKIAVTPERAAEFAMNVRLPAWCREPAIQVNGKPLKTIEKTNGYARLARRWQRGDEIELSMPLPVERIKANPKVAADAGRVALQRGPIVYCLEAIDNGGQVRNLVIPPDAELRAAHRGDLLGGVTIIEGAALAMRRTNEFDKLYSTADRAAAGSEKTEFTAIPYYANANRAPSEMLVWIAESRNKADPSPSPTHK
jgi:DUF1680 family protein